MHVFLEQPKRWDFLAGAFFIHVLAAAVTFVRWRWLVRTFNMQCSHFDAQRLGFLGIFINLTPLGIVGGDGAKAFLLGQKNPEHRSQAVASVIVDRLLGLYVLFLYGTATVLLTGIAFRPELLAKTASYTVFACTAIGTLGIISIFTPLFTSGHFENYLQKLPYIGAPLAKLSLAMLMYRFRKRCLLKAAAASFLVHLLASVSMYLTARSFFGTVPNFLDHLMLYSVLQLVLMIPAAGPFELVFEEMYHQLFGMYAGTGLIVALGIRVITTLVCCVGGIFAFDGTLKTIRNKPLTMDD
ncbi:hypothetical protein FACS1894170_05500 [Planctomycetales bacterium]|nr:hypothetical protein FACS1894170_05500 [Planctomycetales bacterium]